MAHTQEVTPYYIRTFQGETFYVDTLEEALSEFVSDDRGYRLTLTAGENEIVIRRGVSWEESALDGEKESPANIIWRKVTEVPLYLIKE